MEGAIVADDQTAGTDVGEVGRTAGAGTFIDLNADAHEEVRAPSLVSTATLTSTGQLPKFADDAYAIERDGLWCSPTAEAPLTSIYAGEILAPFPLTPGPMTSLSP